MNLQRDYPGKWKLLWQVAFGEYERTWWANIPPGMRWLKARDFVEFIYHSPGEWTFAITEVGKKQL